MADIRYSIIVPFFNNELFIEKCLTSLSSQTISSSLFEVILVNDGATDNSGVIASSFANLYPNWTMITEVKNLGVANARNIGVAVATGEYILFVDSDD